MIKEWWNNLAEREQRLISVGAVVGVILLGYLLVWTPLSSTVASLRDDISSQEQLLSYLNSASQAIDRLRAAGIVVVTDTSQDVTTQAENMFSAQGVSAFVKQVQQPATDEATFTLESVPFDKLMHALHALAQSNVHVMNFTAIRQSESGVADVTLTLKKQ